MATLHAFCTLMVLLSTSMLLAEASESKVRPRRQLLADIMTQLKLNNPGPAGLDKNLKIAGCPQPSRWDPRNCKGGPLDVINGPSYSQSTTLCTKLMDKVMYHQCERNYGRPQAPPGWNLKPSPGPCNVKYWLGDGTDRCPYYVETTVRGDFITEPALLPDAYSSIATEGLGQMECTNFPYRRHWDTNVDARTCGAYCASNDGCRFFSLNGTGTCLMYQSCTQGLRRVTAGQPVFQYYVMWNNLAPYRYDRLEGFKCLTEPYRFDYVPSTSEAVCRRLCAIDPRCTAVSLDKATEKCNYYDNCTFNRMTGTTSKEDVVYRMVR